MNGLQYALYAAAASGGGPGFVADPAIAGTNVAAFPANATAQIRFNNTGTVTLCTTPTPPHTWLLLGAAADYEIYVTGTGTAPTGSAVDTWLGLGTSRQWDVARSGVGTNQFTGTYSIRLAATGAVVGGNSFTLTATVE